MIDRIIYFLKKFLNFFLDIHWLSYLAFLIIFLALFFSAKKLISKNSRKPNVKAFLIVLCIVIPILLLIVFLISNKVLENQPFQIDQYKTTTLSKSREQSCIHTKTAGSHLAYNFSSNMVGIMPRPTLSSAYFTFPYC